MQSTGSCSRKLCRGCFGEIAEIVADTDGLFNGQTKYRGTSHDVNVIWRVMGELLEDMLIRRKSGVVPDFLHASIKVHKVPYFDGSVHVYHKPQLVLLPDFTSKFHMKNVLEMRDAHYHATVPSSVGYTTIAAVAGMDRYTVEAAVKDSIREIGRYLSRNPNATLTIDIGVGFLEFHDREYRMKWCPDFLARLKATLGSGAVVTPYDPPSMTVGGPEAACRLQKGCTSKVALRDDVEATIDAESRLSVAEMNDGMGGSGYRKTYW